MLEARGLSLDRGGARVLRGVTCALEPGCITAITGPNGAGKSSLLMALAGLLDPADGEVLLNGRDLARMKASERARVLGYLPQGSDIAWDVSLEALVALGRIPHGDARSDRGRAAIERAIATLGLDPLRGRRAGRMSGGEKARALLARVLAGEPNWILADEPLAALDLAHQVSLIEHLEESAASGTGIAIVLHDLALAMNHADRVLVLDRGELVADAAPDEALSEARIAQVWGVAGEWIGTKGRRALVVHAR